jgi:siroheme synthase (precorrin-2 oxidase/ferrochelatase)
MSNPLVHAFFVGRAFAEALGEEVEASLTNALSDLGRFDAEQRERLRQFVEQVLERASREEALSMQNQTSSVYEAPQQQDLQAMIDELRAETAQLRAELQRYRSHSN